MSTLQDLKQIQTQLAAVIAGLEHEQEELEARKPLDLAAFFNAYREAFGKVKQEQVQPLEFWVAKLAAWPVALRDAAYILASVKHETRDTYQPVKEAYWVKNPEAYRKTLSYYPWYGRGPIQITHKRNYLLAGRKLGLDLTTDPDTVMDLETGFKIAVMGCLEGWFTGKKLSDYDNYKDKRRVVNGTDDDDLIAGYAEKFEACLKQAGYSI